MKDVFILTWMEFRKEEQNVINNALVFSNEQAAIDFKKTLHDIQCCVIGRYHLLDTAAQALKEFEGMKND